MDDLYRELILDHYRNPRKKGLLSDPSIDYEDNPVCGDHVHLTIKLDENDVAGRWLGRQRLRYQPGVRVDAVREPDRQTLEEIRQIDKDAILECSVLSWGRCA
jgi:nitrogen fixation NifU-like protein